MSEKPKALEVLIFLFVLVMGLLFWGWGWHEFKARREFKRGWQELEDFLDEE